jgi:hypothetical protein
MPIILQCFLLTPIIPIVTESLLNKSLKYLEDDSLQPVTAYKASLPINNWRTAGKTKKDIHTYRIAKTVPLIKDGA